MAINTCEHIWVTERRPDGVTFCSICRTIRGLNSKRDRKPNQVPANETPRIELLERDVMILLQEVRQLRAENEKLKNSLMVNELLKERLVKK